MGRAYRCVVTGGAGFIGSHLVDRLLGSTSAQVVVIDNFSRGRRANLGRHLDDPRLQIMEMDIREGRAVEQVFDGANIVFHLAAQVPPCIPVPGDDEEIFSTNVRGTFNVLQAAMRARVRRVVFTSSVQVYGEPIELPVDEGHPLVTVTTYGASKISGEAYCGAFRHGHGLETAILRLAKVYGPRDASGPIPSWLERATVGEDLDVFGGDRIVDLVWVGYVVDALMGAGSLKASVPPINVASGSGTSLLNIAKRITDLTQGRSQVRLRPPCTSDAPRFVGSVDRMRHLLGITPPRDPLAELPQLLEAPALARV